MVSKIKMGIVIFFLVVSGLTIYSYDRADDGVKILNDDDFKEIESNYKIPRLIPEDYDCENHPGFISDSNPSPNESQQEYSNRKVIAIQNQIEEVCD